MSQIKLESDMQKSIEVILYIANHTQNPTIMSVLKLMYLADKMSLEEYGRFFSGETYVAMQHGPVHSVSYDLMKAARETDQYGFVIQHSYHIKPLRDSDLDEMSDSDIRCLDKIIKLFGEYPAYHLREISHDIAWKKTWLEAEKQGSSPIPIERIINTFDNAEDLAEYFFNKHTD